MAALGGKRTLLGLWQSIGGSRPLAGPLHALRSLCRHADVPILCFQGSVLEQAEEADARDVLEAVKRVAGTPPHLKVEVWSKHHQVAEIRPSPTYRPMPRHPKPN